LKRNGGRFIRPVGSPGEIISKQANGVIFTPSHVTHPFFLKALSQGTVSVLGINRVLLLLLLLSLLL
jgi:hypothetical protein